MKRYFENVKKTSPLIHCITNYVTVNDCANILIAAGGSPIMSDDIEDAPAITAICTGLCINIGTLNSRTIPAMFASGKKSNELNHPVLLDPVGAGASPLRTQTASGLLEELEIAVVRGNMSEIKALAMGSKTTKGVDANAADTVNSGNIDAAVDFAKDFARSNRTVAAITGAVDIVANSKKAFVIYNGVPMMSQITGSGCMLSALTAAFVAANKDNPLEASAAAVAAMGVCGEIAFEKTIAEKGGNSSFRNHLIDAFYNLDSQIFEEKIKYEIR